MRKYNIMTIFLSCSQMIHNFITVQVWVVCTILGILMNASVPLGMEMAADAGYPVCEGTSTSIVVWLFNVLSFILLFVLGFFPSKLCFEKFIFN